MMMTSLFFNPLKENTNMNNQNIKCRKSISLTLRSTFQIFLKLSVSTIIAFLKSYLIFLSDHMKCNQTVKTSEKIFEEV